MLATGPGCDVRAPAGRYLADPWVRHLWEGFVTSLLDAKGAGWHLAQWLGSSIGFFVELADLFPGGHGMNAHAYALIDSRVMRRHLLAPRFVASTLEPHSDSLKTAAVEARRLGRARPIVQGRPLGKEALIAFLRRWPGSAAGISAFVSFCRSTARANLAMPSRTTYERTAADEIARQVGQLKDALRRTSAFPPGQAPEKVVVRVLAIALDLSQADLRRQRSVAVILEDGSIRLSPDVRIACSDALHPFAQRWIQISPDGAASP